MALKNNQSVGHKAYLVRFADAEPDIKSAVGWVWIGDLNGAIVRTFQPDPNYGLQLSTVSTPAFSFWQGYVQSVNTGPNACAFAFDEADFNYLLYQIGSSNSGRGSIEVAFAAQIGAGQTKTVTLSYRGF